MHSERPLTRRPGDVTNVLGGPAVETLVLVGVAEDCEDEADELSEVP